MIMAVTKTYSGKIYWTCNCECDDLLGVDDKSQEDTNILAEMVMDDMDEYGVSLTVRYWVSDEAKTKDELEENLIRQICGDGNASYWMKYSEITGYIGTTEELEVGGHDLLRELESFMGKYLYMEIDYHQQTESRDLMKNLG